MAEPLSGEFVVNTRTADEPATPDEAASRNSIPVTIRNGGTVTMEKGRLEWYYRRLKELDTVDGSYAQLLFFCLTSAERVKVGLPSESAPLSPWFVSVLIDRGFLVVRNEGDAPWKIEFSADARRVIRASITRVDQEFKLVNPVVKPKPTS